MFAELLACSCFSFLRGASHPEELIDAAKAEGIDAIALCDRGGLYGMARAHERARALGQRLIVGAEIPVEGGAPRASAGAPAGDGPTIALLAADHEGYSRLCRLLTRAHAGRPKGESAIGLAELADSLRGLFAVVPAPSAPGAADQATPELLATVRDLFGERAAIAVYRHLDGFDGARTELVLAWTRRYGLPAVASARPLYHRGSRKRLADVLHCIKHGLTLDAAGTRLGVNGEAVLRGDQTMRKLFADRPEWVDRSWEIAAGLSFGLDELRYRFPCELEEGESADDKLRRLVGEGGLRRYPAGVPARVAAQLAKELALIQELGVAPYFLSTWEIVEIARRRRILCQGRGSAANSAVCYVLGITAVDPARSSLLFERFMSPERREPPDIDIDFEHERREEVIQEIYARYGRDRAAMVAEVICYRGKSALREVGKAFGLSLEQVDRLSSTIGYWDSAEMVAARLREMGFDDGDVRLRQVVMLARALQGFPRHLSIHVGGFVLSATPLDEVAPIEPATMPGRTVIPWDKDDLDTLGFFKIDVLGLGMLTAIRKCLGLVHADGGLDGRQRLALDVAVGDEPFDPLEVITRVPAEDPEVYRMVSRADTVGVFQIESRAQMAMLPRLRPQRFYDLVIEVAIVRPGPIQGGMVHPYLRRRNGEEPLLPPHPSLTPILERTLGVPLFQEQVMQIAIVGAGYSGGEADQLRRDMAAWRKSGKLLRHRERLLAGFARNGINSEFGEALFEQIKGFGEYGFPESHAASFALLVYTSAWQKAHYPAHFAAALLNSQPMGFYSPSAIVRDAQRHGVEVRDVCVVASDWDATLEAAGDECRIGSRWTGARKALRLGLRLVRGLGEPAARRIERARAERAFSDLEDLVRRARLRKDLIETLAEAGALEALVRGRRQALWQARAPRVGGLFEHTRVSDPAIVLPPLRAAEQLALDYGRKGLSVDDHPMRHLRARMSARGVHCARELGHIAQGTRVGVAGLVTCRQQPATASGVVFVTLEDETGYINLVLYRRVFERFGLAARHAALLLAWGKIERDPSAKGEAEIVHVIASEIERLDVPEAPLRKMSRDFH